MGGVRTPETPAAGAPDLDLALSDHLSHGHPPLLITLLDTCKQAIAYANNNEWNRRVLLPRGIGWKGQESAPTAAIIEELRLEGFLSGERDDR